MAESYGYTQVPEPPQPRPPQRDRGWGSRVLLAAVIVSLVVGGVAGALVGGGATYAVLKMQGLRQATPLPAAPVQTAPVQTGLPPAVVTGPEPVAAQGGVYTVADVADKVGPAVVTVVNQMEAQLNPFGFGQVSPQASGSGIIIDPRGYIVTNYHVVESAVRLTVIFQDGVTKTASLIGNDYPFNDLAVIKVDGANYPYAQLGDSDSLRVGEPVVAIGSALGDFHNTVTTGVVSGLGRSLRVDENTVMEGLIQTDAAINHGNSGGPLTNMEGLVVGINTAIIRSTSTSGDPAEGLGFSIPSNAARYVADQLIATGKVARPYLGVRSVTVNQSLAAYYNLPVSNGLYVTEVVRDSPADRAGVKIDDIIVRIGDYSIDEDHPLINVLSHFQSGQTTTLSVNRGGRELQMEISLGERP